MTFKAHKATTQNKSIEVRLFDRYSEVMPIPASTLISNKNVLDVEYLNAYTVTSSNTDTFHPNRELLIKGAVDTLTRLKYGRNVNNRLLLKSLVIELRASIDEAQRPKAQALLETSAAAPGGLFKTFDDYERSGYDK